MRDHNFDGLELGSQSDWVKMVKIARDEIRGETTRRED